MNAPATVAIRAFAGGPAPLHLVGEFVAELGRALQGVIDAHPTSQFFPRASATHITLNSDGTVIAYARQADCDGSEHVLAVHAESVVVATGGRQSATRVLQERVASVPMSPGFEHKVMLTETLLSPGGVEEAQRRLHDAGRRNVLIIGGSHSAFSSAWVLLNKLDAMNMPFGAGDITILHRDKLKLFYPTKEAAWAEGYTDFDDADICPLTRRVYRLGGFRFDSRELLMRIWGMGGRTPETRIRLMRLRPDQGDAREVRRLFEEAAMIIPAFGYRPAAIDVFDADGNPVELMCRGEGTPPMVDRQCRVLDGAGQPIPRVYGIGLASGFVPSGALGGEPSFRGQTNGLWLYQNGVGQIILDQILENGFGFAHAS